MNVEKGNKYVGMYSGFSVREATNGNQSYRDNIGQLWEKKKDGSNFELRETVDGAQIYDAQLNGHWGRLTKMKDGTQLFDDNLGDDKHSTMVKAAGEKFFAKMDSNQPSNI